MPRRDRNDTSRRPTPGSEPADVEATFARYQRTGAPDALGAVFDATAGELFRVASHLAPDLHAAEDLVQATFLAAIERRDRYRPEGAGVLAWLLGILANRARRLHAQRVPDPARVDSRRAPDDPAAIAAGREIDDHLTRAVEGLHEPYRVVLRMHLRHGLPANEIALLLERPPGTVRTQLVRGMELLRRALPAGIAVGAAFVATPLRGMQAIREVVSDAARAAVGSTAGGVAAGAGALALGGVIMQKVVLSAVVAAAVLLGWVFWPDDGNDAGAHPGLIAGRASEAIAANRHDRAARSPTAPDVRDPVRESADSVANAGKAALIGRGLARVSGRLLDRTDRRPLAGVPLRLVRLNQLGLENAGRAQSDERVRQHRVSDAEGRFVFDVAVDPRWFQRLTVSAAEHAEIRMTIVPPEPGAVELGDVLVPRLTDITGRVIDATGRAVGGARVFFEPAEEEMDNQRPAYGFVFNCMCDAQGEFKAPERYAAAPWRVEVRRCGMPTTSRFDLADPTTTLPLRIVVPAAEDLQFIGGTVRDATGAPVANADVSLVQEGLKTVYTDPDGRFRCARMRGKGADATDMVVRHSKFDAWRGQVEWGNEAVGVVLEGRAQGELEIEVVHAATGEPVEEFGVYVRGDPLRMKGTQKKRPRPGHHADGRFRIGGLRQGAHLVQVVPADDTMAASAVHEVSVTGDARLRVELHPNTPRSIVIVHGAGAPVVGSRVTWIAAVRDVPLRPETRVTASLDLLTSSVSSRPGHLETWSEALLLQRAETDERGTVVLRGGPHPRMALHVEGPDHLPLFVDEFEFDAAGPTRVTVQAGASIAGRVEPARVAEELRAGMWLVDVDDPMRQIPMAKTASLVEAQPIAVDGTFRFPQVPAGRWRLHLAFSHSGLSRLVPLTAVTVAAQGGSLDVGAVDIEQLQPGRLGGRILVDGSPLANGSLEIRPDAGTTKDAVPLNLNGRPTILGVRGTQGSTDALGHFEIPLVRGRYALHAVIQKEDGSSVRLKAPWVEITPGVARDEVFVLRHIRLRVRVLDSRGEPVAKRRCSIEDYGRHRTDAAGWITLDPAPLEPFLLRVQPAPPPGGWPDVWSAAQATPIVLGPVAVPLEDIAEVTLQLSGPK